MKQISNYFRIALLCMGLTYMVSCNSSKSTDETTVHIKGQLIDMGTTEVIMRYGGASSMLGNSKNILLKTDNQGNFDTTLVLNEPTYFDIMRNTLYLSPGDDLTIKITQDNTEATFEGIGAEANTYLKKRNFPKAGSFLESGENIIGNFQTTKAHVDSLAADRMKELDALKNVSATFKDLERARIKSDILISYLFYPTYASMVKDKLNIPDEEINGEMLYPKIETELLALLNEINKPEYLDVAAVREVLSMVSSPYFANTFNGKFTVNAPMKELNDGVTYMQKLAKDASKVQADSVAAFIQTVKNKDFASEMQKQLDDVSRLFEGKPAVDFSMTDLQGNAVRLSDFKGKVIYLDIWATWCGPCLQESPKFELLSKKFEGKDIVFIAISIDKDREEWSTFLQQHKKSTAQYHAPGMDLTEGWKINGIPRFILIDKDFKIANSNAPRPSEEVTEALINSLLN